jgi:hypothetical protein
MVKSSPPSVALSRLDYSETGGRSSIGSRALTLMFFLTDAPVADFPVTLRISPTYPGFIPESVTIPAGSSSYQISMVVPPVSGSLYRLTAADAHGVTQTLTIYLM